MFSVSENVRHALVRNDYVTSNDYRSTENVHDHIILSKILHDKTISCCTCMLTTLQQN